MKTKTNLSKNKVMIEKTTFVSISDTEKESLLNKLSFFWNNNERFLYNKTRMNHRLYAKYLKIKHEEKTQIFEDNSDRMGVKIDWDLFGKILEAKHRRIQGESVVIPENEPIEVKEPFLTNLYTNVIKPFFFRGKRRFSI